MIDEMGAGMYKGQKISLEERKKQLSLSNQCDISLNGKTTDIQSEDGVRVDHIALNDNPAKT
jgi:hypothetical protein